MANGISFTQGSRNEAILHEIINKLNGEQVGELQPPRSRVEILLQEILEKIGGGEVDPEAIEQAVYDWLDEHPEATTTVEDGAISYAKLNNTLKTKLGAIVSVSGTEVIFTNVDG